MRQATNNILQEWRSPLFLITLLIQNYHFIAFMAVLAAGSPKLQHKISDFEKTCIIESES